MPSSTSGRRTGRDLREDNREIAPDVVHNSRHVPVDRLVHPREFRELITFVRVHVHHLLPPGEGPPVHRSKVLKRWIAGHPRVVLKTLPRYSPDINPLEQWWNYERAKLFNNRYFPTNRRLGGEECVQPNSNRGRSQIAVSVSRNAITLTMPSVAISYS